MKYYIYLVWGMAPLAVVSVTKDAAQQLAAQKGTVVALEEMLNQCTLDMVGNVIGWTLGAGVLGALLPELPGLISRARTAGGWTGLTESVGREVQTVAQEGGTARLSTFERLHNEFHPPVIAELQPAPEGVLVPKLNTPELTLEAPVALDAESAGLTSKLHGGTGPEIVEVLEPVPVATLARGGEETAVIGRAQAMRQIGGDIKEEVTNQVMSKLEGQVPYRNGLRQAVSQRTGLDATGTLLKDQAVMLCLARADMTCLRALKNSTQLKGGITQALGKLSEEQLGKMFDEATAYRAQFYGAVKQGVSDAVDGFITQESKLFSGQSASALGQAEIIPEERAYQALVDIFQKPVGGQAQAAHEGALSSLGAKLHTNITGNLSKLPTHVKGQWAQQILGQGGSTAKGTSMRTILDQASQKLLSNQTLQQAQAVWEQGGNLDQVVLSAQVPGQGEHALTLPASTTPPAPVTTGASEITSGSSPISGQGSEITGAPVKKPAPEVPGSSYKQWQASQPKPQVPSEPAVSPQPTPTVDKNFKQVFDKLAFTPMKTYMPSAQALRAVGAAVGTTVGLGASLGTGLSQMGLCYAQALTYLHLYMDPHDFGPHGPHAYLFIQNRTDYPITITMKEDSGSWTTRTLAPSEDNHLFPLPNAHVENITISLPGGTQQGAMQPIVLPMGKTPDLNSVVHAVINYSTVSRGMVLGAHKGVNL